MFAGFPNHAVSSANYVWDHHFFFPFIFQDIGFDKLLTGVLFAHRQTCLIELGLTRNRNYQQRMKLKLILTDDSSKL